MKNKDLQKEIREYISSNTENPADVIMDATNFICSIMDRNTYGIFQSDFAFMDTDGPFTMIVEKFKNIDDNTLYRITFWSADWTSFNILQQDYVHIADKWDIRNFLKDNIPEHSTLTAKEIIEHPKFRDNILYGKIEETADLFKTVHYILQEEYGWNSQEEEEWDDYPCNPQTSGIVAVIYREPELVK